MDIKNTLTKEKIILYVVVLMQVYALTFYTQFGAEKTGSFEKERINDSNEI